MLDFGVDKPLWYLSPPFVIIYNQGLPYTAKMHAILLVGEIILDL